MLDDKKKVIFIAGLTFSLILLVLFIFSSSQNISFFTGKYIEENTEEESNKNEIVKNVFLDEYTPKSQGQEEIFFDKKFHDNGRYIISSLNEYSAEWYPDDSPKKDLKKLTVELQITDKTTWKNFSIKGTADIPKYYYGSFDFDTNQENFVVFKDINPDFIWEYSEDYEIVSVEKKDETIFEDGKIISQTFVKEKKFDNYKKIDSENKNKIPKELFLDPDISACGTLGSAGATYDLTAHVSTVTPGTCFTVTAANVTLDCHGYWVNYSGATPFRYGVYTDQFNTTVKNCKINNFNTTIGYYDSIGIYFLGADNGTIFNCYANNSNSAGIYLTGNANYNNITNSIGITANSSQGIRLHDSHYNILLNNVGITKTNEGFGVTGGSSYNTIINQTAFSQSGRGVFFWQGAHDNVLIGLNASTSTSGEAIRFHNATNNIIMDCVFLDGASYDIYYYTELGSTGNVFLNCDYDTEYITPSNSLIRQWYYRAYVNYSNGTAAAGVNVSGYNTSNILQFTANTNSAGWITRQNVTEYVNNGGTRSYYNNYIIHANKTSTSNDTNIFNFTITQNKINDFFTLTSIGGEKILRIINPRTSRPLSVSSKENISIYFNVSNGGSNVTSGVKIDSVFIGGINSTILNMTGVNGSDSVTVPISCVDNIYSSLMEAYSNWTIPGTGDINVTSFFLFQNDTSMDITENTTIKLYHANGTEIVGTEIVVYGTGTRGWTYANYSTPFTLTRGKSYFVGILMYPTFNLARDSGSNCAEYLPNQGSYYPSPSDGILDSTVPTAIQSSYHYGIFGVGYETYGDVPSNKYITNVGWQVNVTTPSGLRGYQDLFVNASYNSSTLNDTQSNAINYIWDSTAPIISFEPPTPTNSSITSSPVTIVANISDSSNTSSWIDIDRTLVGYWAMDYANSTHVFDNSSYKIYNASFQNGIGINDKVIGIRGDALHFDGSNGYLRAEISSAYNKMTYSYWMNNDFEVAEIDSSSYEPAFSYNVGNDYGMYFGGDDRYVANFWSTTSEQHYVNWWPSTINKSEWHYFTHVIDSDAGYVSLYVDGVLVGNRTSSPWTPSTKNIFYIGRYSSSYYNGSIDEFMIFNRTLSSAEIKALYSSQINKFNTSSMILADGQYNYIVYAIDEYGNTANSGERNFIVGEGEITPPIITFEEPPTPTNSSITSSPVTIVANISDSSNTSSWIDIDRTLVGYWAMDYYNSTGVYDNSSWNNFGSFALGTGINGISAGIRGNSLEFYGNNSRLNMNKLGSSTKETFNTSGQLTFSAWINPDVISWQGIMGTNTVRFHIAAPSRIRSGIYNATAQYQFDSPDILSAGQWQHIALTYNRSNGNASSYYNGVLVGSRTILNANLTGDIDYFNVGQNWGDFFDGLIDEVMVFNRTLSQSEIKALYNSKVNKFNTSTMNLENGQHNYTVYAIDEYGNAANSGLRNFVVGSGDITPPTISFEPPTPSNGSTTNSKYVEIVANISDTSNTSSWIDLDRTLVGYWAMDYANSTNVFDNSSYKNNATFKGGLSISNITTGVRGNGMDFVGDGGGLGIKYSSQYNITEGITLAIWMKRTTTYTQTRDMHLLSRYPAWHFYDAYNSGRIRGEIFIEGVSRGGLYTRVIPDDGNWYHIVYTYNSTTGHARMYTNGVQDSSENLTGLSNYLIDGNTIADIRDMGWHNLGRGAILDEAMIFSRPLSQSEIKALYNSKINKFNTTNLSYSDGKHNYTVYAIDEYGNTANSGERNFIVSSGIDCGTISNPGVYTLTKNVSSIGTCFTVEAANVTIDCNGYWINYSTGGSTGTYGIHTNQFNTTVKNCNIIDGNFTSSNQFRNGIYFSSADNGTIFNNYVSVKNGYGIYLFNGADFNNITNNYLLSNESYGIVLSTSSKNNLINNTAKSHSQAAIYLSSSSSNSLISNNGTSINGIGIRIQYSTSNSLRNNFALGEGSMAFYILSSNNTFLVNNTGLSHSFYGFDIEYSLNITLLNNNGNSIYLYSTNNSNLTLNKGISNSLEGIYVYLSNNNTLVNNNGTSNTNIGIYLRYSSKNNLINNDATSISSTAIMIGSSSNDNLLIGNNGTQFTNAAGISVAYSINNTLINNVGWGDTGIYLQGGADNSTLINNTGTSKENFYGIYFSQARNNILVNNTGISLGSIGRSGIYFYSSINNTLINNTAITNVGYGIHLQASVNNTFLNQIARTTGTSGVRRGIYIYQSNGTLFRDCVNISGADEDIYYYGTAGSFNNTFINCSYNTAKEIVQGTGNELIRKWYYQAYVNYSNGSAASNVNVSSYNVSNKIQFTKQTNSSGYIPRQEITEYVNLEGTRSYYNNYTINASKPGYITDNNLFNFTITQNKVDDFFTLFLSTCSYSSGNWLINCSENCYIDSNYNIGKNNISIIGVGTVTLSGNISNYNKLLIAGQDSSNICIVRCINGGCFKF